MDWNAVGTWLGLGVSVGGFAIAIVEIRRTRSAAESARAAVVETEARVARNTLLVVVPQLLQLEVDLGSALAASRYEDAATVLVRWRHLAAQVMGLLARANAANAELLSDQLTVAIPLAASAERSLLQRRRPGAFAVREARRSIGDAAAAAGAVMGALQSYTGKESI
ncbi:MAG: hypothetical protein ACRDHF_01010 [Tepidiformaceae bacterium]